MSGDVVGQESVVGVGDESQLAHEVQHLGQVRRKFREGLRGVTRGQERHQ